MDYYVYVIQTKHDLLYCGIAKDYLARFEEHCNQPKKRARFFNSSPPKELVFLYPCESRSFALQIEYEIKQLSKIQKLEICGLI